MKKSSRLFIAGIVCLLPSSTSLLAQVPAHVPDGGARETLISIDVPPKPGAPFTATVVTEWTRVLADGTTTTVKNRRLIARDSSGRVFQERRFLTADGDKITPPLRLTEYANPYWHELYSCFPAAHICAQSTYNHPSAEPSELATTASLPNGSVTREDLGTHYVDDLELLGSRQIVTIKPGPRNGYKSPEPTVKEFWYSPQLGINVITKRFEPRGGAENFTLEDINLGEPDPKLFELPADYKVVHVSVQ